MKFKHVQIPEPSIAFCMPTDGNVQSDIWQQLHNGLWKSINPIAFEQNTQLGELKRVKGKPFLDNILPIYTGMQWSVEEHKLIDPYFKPTIIAASMHSFLEAAANFFNKYKDKHIGVHLSGGLDSSIIIALLKTLNIPFSLVGLTSTRYEFRTERHIQQLLASWAKAAILIDYENFLPLKDIEIVPPHQYPNLLCMNYSANMAMAKAGRKLGIDVLLTGGGGDNVFAEPVPNNPLNCSWMPQSFETGWLNDFTYSQFNIEVVPFYADAGIMNTIYNLRFGQGDDNSKIWARQFFKDILPHELVEHTYCADFWGLDIDGLLNALPIVKDLFEKAYLLTNNNYFSPQSINELLSQDLLNPQKHVYQAIESRIAIAAWLNALFEKD